MGKSHDYQNEMSTETRSLDTAGEQAAEATTAETAPVREEKVVTSSGEDGPQYSKMKGTFGVLPSQEIATDYSRERMTYFMKMAIETRSRRNPLNPLESGEQTAAYKSQQYMAQAYLADQTLINNSQRSYDLLVPLASMAAKSFAKAHEIGQLTGFNDERGAQLSPKEQRALNKAASKLHSPLDEEASLDAASDEVGVARHAMEKASIDLSLTVESEVVRQLMSEYNRASADKAKIEASIHEAQAIVGYLGTAASVIAGGAGFVHEHVSIGKPRPTNAGKTAQEIADGTDLRHSDVEATKDRASQGKEAAGLASSAVAFGMSLYHEKELIKIKATLGTIGAMIQDHNLRANQERIRAAYEGFTAAQGQYQNAIKKYEARINDRRKHMASLGRTADQMVDKTGRNSNASDATLWTASIMETQSFLGTAIHSARQAQDTLNASYSGSNGMREHRTHRWGTLSDIYGPTNTPRSEGESGPDVVALKNMRRLVTLWLEGAEDVSKTINQVAESQGKPVLESVGYTADY